MLTANPPTRPPCPPPHAQVIGAIDGSGRVVLRDREAPEGSPVPVDLDLEKVLGDMPNKTFRCGQCLLLRWPVVIIICSHVSIGCAGRQTGPTRHSGAGAMLTHLGGQFCLLGGQWWSAPLFPFALTSFPLCRSVHLQLACGPAGVLVRGCIDSAAGVCR